jgi:hypothetical protein
MPIEAPRLYSTTSTVSRSGRFLPVTSTNSHSTRRHTRCRTKTDPNPYSPRSASSIGIGPAQGFARSPHGTERNPESIQHRVIAELKKRKFSLIFDDDDHGESADVVGIAEENDHIQVEFWHCKFAMGDKPGARIKELYELDKRRPAFVGLKSPGSVHAFIASRAAPL